MTYRLIIDDDAHDLRKPEITIENPSWRRSMGMHPYPPETEHLGPWVAARTADEAVSIIEERGMPIFASFDHDLGDGKDAMHVVKWIVERDLDTGFMSKDFQYEVHSGNPVGRGNVKGMLDSYIAHRNAANSPD